jgi:hypothetical protein
LDTEQLAIEEVPAETNLRRSRQLTILIWAQAAFLAATYAVGVWLTVEVHGASITTPEVIAHGVASSGFATLTGLVAFLAAVLRKKGIAVANTLLFTLTVVAGATGFSFLGDITNAAVISVTNLSMMVVVGLGMPISGYSLSVLSEEVRGKEHGVSPASVMMYLALGALALTIIAGAGVSSASFYATAVAAHVGLSALTVALVLGALIMTIMEGSETGESKTHWVPQRAGYSLISLAAICLAAGDGVIAVTAGGGISYIIVMAEIGVLVYAFLLLAIAAPYHLAFHLGRLFGLVRRLRPRGEVQAS